ncbi:MAG TPA: acetoacetate--CoA ligase [Nitrososphaerales archaeon]|nr:acetoacetate--CoA ligase [Nitrososphaerales archaeon]
MPRGKLLWEPDEERIRRANITAYVSRLAREGKQFGNYEELWRWSVDNLEEFWQSVWDYFNIISEGRYRRVLSSRSMPGAKWFEGARLNFAEHVFREKREGPAFIARSEDGRLRTTDWRELERMTGSVAEHLREMGVKPGDRVAGYLPNSIEAAVAFLACASVGAVWSGCSPDFGAPSVLDRFGQIGPKVLFAAESYTYGGKTHDRSEALDTILAALPTVKRLVVVGKGSGPSRRRESEWEDLASGSARLRFLRPRASHPLWILYSSGTTGLPKPLVHSTAGILVEHMKILALHNDLKKGDRFFWFTTTGWMMWNYLLGGLLHGTTCVLYDGSPSHPDMNSLWDLVEETGVSFMGASAAYVSSCMKAGIAPGETHRLSKLKGFGSTGSPLSSDAFEWVYGRVKEDLWLASISGGTDLCTPFVGGNPTLPVFSGEIQCRCLGAKVESFDESGRSIIGRTGELVVTEPMPSMPVQMWGDRDGSRYRESYFDMFPGVWRHGDWIEITERGTCVIHGRSDATIKRMGIRIGTSELYRTVESMPEVADVLAVDLEGLGGKPVMFLFVSPEPGTAVNGQLAARIKQKISDDLSRRHVPDFVVWVRGVPRTLNGKRMEVPVKRIFEGAEVDGTLNRGAMADPASIDEYVELARRYRRDGKL